MLLAAVLLFAAHSGTSPFPMMMMIMRIIQFCISICCEPHTERCTDLVGGGGGKREVEKQGAVFGGMGGWGWWYVSKNCPIF